jgi:type VI secretion system protein ImpH
MTGPLGMMPLYYTELILERMRQKDTTLAGFLDLFNHRFVSLFYQAWEKYRVTVAYERGERDRFSHILRDAIGLGTDFLEDRQIVRDDSLLFYSGLLGIHTRPAASLRQILWDYFDVPVEVEQLVGAWHILEDNNQCKFDKSSTYSEQVGLGAIVGDEIWDQQSGVRVRLGPLTLKQYLDFLPTGTAYEPLQAILRFYSGWEIDYEVQLILKRKQVPGCQLGDDSDEGPKLGWVSWAKSTDLNCDPDDTVLRV